MVVGGKIEARPMMYLALSYDHRIVDGPRGRDLPGARQGMPGRSGAARAGFVIFFFASMAGLVPAIHVLAARREKRLGGPATRPRISAEGSWKQLHVLRSHRYRFRPRRLCLRDPRGAAWSEDRCCRKEKTFGGTCLNIGCIPSLKSAAACVGSVDDAGHHFAKMGIKVAPELDRHHAEVQG